MRVRRPERLSWVGLVLWALRIGILVFVLVGSALTLIEGLYRPADWRDLIIFGIAQGSVYALIALGYTLVYGILFMINFAHGEVFMSGAFTAWFVAIALAEGGVLSGNPILGIGILLAVSMLTSMVVAILLERIAYRPLRGAPRLVPLITAIGASLVLQYSARGMYGAGVRAYPWGDVAELQGRIEILGVPVLRTQLIVVAAAVALMVALWYLVQKTRTGRAMRAVSEDKEVAALMGINVDAVIMRTFAIGGLLAGAAAILYTFIFNQVAFSMGFLAGIKAFTAAVLGGIGNIVGAMLGGLILGVLEAVGPQLFLTGFDIPATNQLRHVVAFAMLVLVLIFRPYGLLGKGQ
ncbi:MAG: branched-chain amino acid ABC transporter permease [Chloroflexota bacterium]|nr:branched-chain amino acid ABC transporter permease [Chloroflexota bacterium]